MSNKTITLSVVIPLYNEAESLPELIEWINKVCKQHDIDYEAVFIDDGSKDNSWEVIKKLKLSFPTIKAHRFQRNYGKSAALNVGFRNAIGDIVITMDADLQDSPDEIPELIKMLIEGNFDVISGWKKRRYDPISKTVPSLFFNLVTRLISGIKIHDFNCGLKAYRKEVVKSIEVYGEMHRYIPFLAKAAGFNRIGEKVIDHRARKYGVSKFGLERFINGFLDLLSLSFIIKFGRKPMHFFGSLGVMCFVAGFFTTGYLIVEKLYKLYIGVHPSQIRPIVEQPLFYLSLVALVSGLQMFLAGFLGELIARSSSDRNSFLISESI
jgi:glycosyltransferase involved in cell wall biosynthesis